jgi:hypothetical protein
MQRPPAAGHPVWRAVQILERDPKGSNHKLRCLRPNCPKSRTTFVGGRTRAIAHVMGTSTSIKACKDPDPEIVRLLQAELDVQEAQRAQKRKRQDLQTALDEGQLATHVSGASNSIGSTGVGATPGSGGASSSKVRVVLVVACCLCDEPHLHVLILSTPSLPQQMQQRRLEGCLNLAARRAADDAVCDFVYGDGIPLNVARSERFKKLIEKVAAAGPGYVAPGYNAMRTTQLAAAVKRVNAGLLTFNKCISDTGAALCIDGWDDAQSNPLINVCLCTAKGSKFVTAVDTSGKTKDADLLFEIMDDAIELCGGADNIVLVITDGASNCKRAGELIEEKYPHVFWLHCAAHVCDLALEEIFREVPLFNNTHSAAKDAFIFIRNHHSSLAAYKSIEGAKALLKPPDTRFAASCIMLERAREVTPALKQLVVSDQWDEMRKRMSRDDKAKADAVSTTLLDNNFWQGVDKIITVTQPIYELLRLADGDVPSIGKVYARASAVQSHINNSTLTRAEKDEVQRIFLKRWTQLHAPIHGAAYCLDPEYWLDKDTTAENECFGNFLAVIDKAVPEADRQLVRQQYSAFKNKEGMFGSLAAEADASVLPSWQWWGMYGLNTPELMRLARRLLAQVTSSSACERVWSTYGFIHSRTRNRLTPPRARDLVYIFTNMRLQEKLKMINNEEKFIAWLAEQEEDEQEEEVVELD